jgi:hypothetical protein
MKQQDLPDNWNGEFVAHEKWYTGKILHLDKAFGLLQIL